MEKLAYSTEAAQQPAPTQASEQIATQAGIATTTQQASEGNKAS